jgi:hypothetical protein
MADIQESGGYLVKNMAADGGAFGSHLEPKKVKGSFGG